jgi:hypothetical protein
MLGKNIIVEKPKYVFTLLENDISIIKKPCGILLESMKILLEGFDHCFKGL